MFLGAVRDGVKRCGKQAWLLITVPVNGARQHLASPILLVEGCLQADKQLLACTPRDQPG